MFKLEAEVIKRNPDFDMNSRLVLNNINPITFKYKLDDKEYDLIDTNLGLDYDNPYFITEEEQTIVKELCKSFRRSMRLKEHIKFIVEKGSVYKCFNGNLLFHGCIPLNEDGTFKDVKVIDEYYHGKELLDRINQLIIKVSKGKANAQELDYMYYLWGGYDSPFTGRLYKTFEVNFVKDKEAQSEPRNPYYEYRNSVNKCKMILIEFGLNPKYGHIINGHLPVKAKLGENPVFANGKLVIIDFQTYQKLNRIKAHEEFSSKVDVVNNNNDILSDQRVIEYFETRIRVRDCDNGKEILKMSKAKIMFYIGADLEGFIEKSEAIFSDKPIKLIELSNYVQLCKQTGDGFTYLTKEDFEMAKGVADTHIWLDPLRMVKMAEVILGNLIEIDPENESEYRKNAEELIAKLKELDNEFVTKLSNESLSD